MLYRKCSSCILGWTKEQKLFSTASKPICKCNVLKTHRKSMTRKKTIIVITNPTCGGRANENPSSITDRLLYAPLVNSDPQNEQSY